MNLEDMKDSLEFKDYQVDDKHPMSSEFLNKIFKNFSNNMLYLYNNFKMLVSNINNYKSNISHGIDWYVRQTASQAVWNSYKYSISSYSTPIQISNIVQDSLNGVIYLKSSNEISKITRYTDLYNNQLAFESTQIRYFLGYKSGTDILFESDLVEDNNIRKVINNKNDIFTTYTSKNGTHDYEYIKVIISLSDIDTKKIDILECFPYGGTELVYVNFIVNSVDNIVEINSKFPYKVIDNIENCKTIELVFKGVLNSTTNKYYFGIRYVDMYNCSYNNSGSFVYELPAMQTLNYITINDDYIKEELQNNNVFRFQLYYKNDYDNGILSNILYDSNVNTYPIQSSISLDEDKALTLVTTLNKIENVSPNIKWIKVG